MTKVKCIGIIIQGNQYEYKFVSLGVMGGSHFSLYAYDATSFVVGASYTLMEVV